MALSDGGKRCGCGQGHETFGACLRAKSVSVQYPSVHDAVRGWDNRLSDFRHSVENGVEPESTRRSDVDAAQEKLRTLKD